MLEKSAELYAWLEDGAHFYVCGDADHMAKDVEAALLEIIVQERGCSADDAGDYLTRLIAEERYQRDVY
jgi:sulfite reductase (NADPH) flavoprotein alpha-component